MKTAVLLVSVLCSSIANHTFATGTTNIDKQLNEVVKFEKNALQIQKNESAFVRVSFKVNKRGKIEVLESNYSNKAVKQQLMEKLEQVTIETPHDVDKVYYYNFTFKKM